MADTFASSSQSLVSPAKNGQAVTPNDVTELTNVSRGIYVGIGGDLSVVMEGGQTITFPGVPGGSLLPIRANIVRSTGTTADSIVAVW